MIQSRAIPFGTAKMIKTANETTIPTLLR